MNAARTICPSDIAIIGAGTYGPVIAELAESCGYEVVAFLDDATSGREQKIEGVSVTGPVASALNDVPTTCAVAVAIGDNAKRLHWLRKARERGHSIPSLISPHAIVSNRTKIGEAVYLHAGCHVWTFAELGMGTILSPNATVAHHTKLEPGCFVSTGANLGASILVRSLSTFGIGSTVSTTVEEIGLGTLVGAGAVVIRDTQELGIYVGSPAKLLKKRHREEQQHSNSPSPASGGLL